MKEIERLKKAILDEYPRLTTDSKFTFACHPGVPCFNACCGDINIFLTPYDVIRLKNRLGVTSGEFLSKFTISPFDENSKYPVLLFKMQENEGKTCHFVKDEGCSVYEDRPWSCRMYPLGLAAPKEDSKDLDKEFYFILKEDVCKGHCEAKTWTVGEWIENQQIDEYNEMGELFKDITLHDFFEKGGNMDPQKMDMFFTACYNVDKFRDFVFNSSFLDKFEVDHETQEMMRTDDIEMLKFGYQWIRFAIFGEKTMKIKSDVMDAKQKEINNSKRN